MPLQDTIQDILAHLFAAASHVSPPYARSYIFLGEESAEREEEGDLIPVEGAKKKTAGCHSELATAAYESANSYKQWR